MNQIQNDEIDVFGLLKTLWDGKWFLSAFIALTTLMGFLYTQVTDNTYNVSVPYTINIYSMSSHQKCSYNVKCLEKEARKDLQFFLKGGWNKNLSFLTKNPLDSSKYEAQIKRANVALTNDLYVKAKTDLTLMQTEMTSETLKTETVARVMVNAVRIIHSIDSGQRAITFGSVSIVNISEVKTILALSIVLGGLFGVLFIFVRNAIKKRKEQLANE